MFCNRNESKNKTNVTPEKNIKLSLCLQRSKLNLHVYLHTNKLCFQQYLLLK